MRVRLVLVWAEQPIWLLVMTQDVRFKQSTLEDMDVGIEMCSGMFIAGILSLMCADICCSCALPSFILCMFVKGMGVCLGRCVDGGKAMQLR